jgi:hypothetical protein
MRSAPARAADASSRPIPIKAGRKWFGRVLRRREPAATEPASGMITASDGLDAFAEESSQGTIPVAIAPAPVAAPPTHTGGQRLDVSIIVALAVLVAGVAAAVYFAGLPQWLRLRAPEPAQGKLIVSTVPAGAEVVIDGKAAGLTPLTVAVAAGQHTVVLKRGGDERSLPVSVNAGSEISQYVEFGSTAAPTPRVGRIAVTTEPAGARVSVDGRLKGSAPLTLVDLPAGEHTVSVASEGGAIERKVVVEAGGTTSVVFSLPKTAGPASGWLSVAAPFDVQIFENTDLVGTSGTTRIMLTAGRHDFRLVNQGLGYEETRRIDIAAGKLAAVRVEPPKAVLSANAKPWADVIIDGANVGQTPLANLTLSIGSHQVTFRHPQFGERKQTVLVTAKGPNRISADMTKP